MRRFLLMGAYLAWICTSALGAYELTAKSPRWLGRHLPGREACRRAELTTAWNPPTGVTPLDRILHEVEEAARYYGLTRRP